MPASLWSPLLILSAAERRPERGRGGGKEGRGLRLTQSGDGDGNGGWRGGRRRRARVDRDEGVPVVSGRGEGADGVGGDGAKPEVAAPRREEVPADDGARPELDGDGGEREWHRELSSGVGSGQGVAKTGEGVAGGVHIATGDEGEDQRAGNRRQKSQPPSIAPARFEER